ncbi:hypothetical protein VPHK389_0024 [Vibrio phage K389]|nr:hypothetical protein SIPHO010v1_p0070 [Vibrio phage 268E42.1]
MSEGIVKRAESMALEMGDRPFRYWRYRIKDNPHVTKRNRVIWHNAFYDKCREIGRRI